MFNRFGQENENEKSRGGRGHMVKGRVLFISVQKIEPVCDV